MSSQPNYKHYTRGGQISFHNLRMWDQINKMLLMICLFIWILVTGLITWHLTSNKMLIQALWHYYAKFLDLVGQKTIIDIPFHGHVLKQNVAVVAHHPFYI